MILISKDTKVIVQGATGKMGSAHTKRMIAYGTKVVGGVTPGKGGTKIEGIPVFDTVKEAFQATGATTSSLLSRFHPPSSDIATPNATIGSSNINVRDCASANDAASPLTAHDSLIATVIVVPIVPASIIDELSIAASEPYSAGVTV